MHDDRLEKGDEVGPTVQFVKALVLKAGTPVPMCQLAAGHHQVLQTNTSEVQPVDVEEAIINACHSKMSQTGNPSLNDVQLYRLLASHGLHKGDTSLLNKELSNITVAEAHDRQNTSVCYGNFFSNNFISSALLRWTISLNSGAKCINLWLQMSTDVKC